MNKTKLEKIKFKK